MIDPDTTQPLAALADIIDMYAIAITKQAIALGELASLIRTHAPEALKLRMPVDR